MPQRHYYSYQKILKNKIYVDIIKTAKYNADFCQDAHWQDNYP